MTPKELAHQQDVSDRGFLAVRIMKWEAYRDSDKFGALDGEEKSRLQQAAEDMRQQLAELDERIAAHSNQLTHEGE